MEEFTRKFNVAQEKDAEIRHILTTVYAALEDKGYNPINQIVGYILSEDPTYITNHNNAPHADPQAGSRRAAANACAQLPRQVSEKCQNNDPRRP